MNAHINYDLSYVVEAKWSITDRTDYLRVNDVLQQTMAEIQQEMESNYDAAFNYLSTPLTDPLILDMLILWRENAYINGTLLSIYLLWLYNV